MRRYVVAIIQARMGSTRFPGKVLSLIHGKPALQRVVERVKQAKKVDAILVATTTSYQDVPIKFLCEQDLGVFCFRGSENDVLLRVFNAASVIKATHIVDITADCPMVDPVHIDRIVKTLITEKADYVSNVVWRDWADGFDVQACTMKVLAQSRFEVPLTSPHRGHSLWNILQYKKSLARCVGKEALDIIHCPEARGYHHPELGLTLDEPEDRILLEEIHKGMVNKNNILTASAEEITNYVYTHYNLLEINKHVKRKVPGEG